MNVTLFIDESGDFESQRGEWLISCVLFEGALKEVTNTLNVKLAEISKIIGVNSIKDFHLTEFRRDFGHPIALQKAEFFIKKISKLDLGFKSFAVINYSKFSLSEREKTYRAMLCDMIILVDSSLGDEVELSGIDLVVATRTIKGELQTTLEDLRKDVINSLPESLEYDLASLGLAKLIGKNFNVSLEYANTSWGLVCADFIANINYHRNKQAEKELLCRLELSGHFRVFEAFGNHSERRARIAERNNDFVLAIFRWLVVSSSSNNPSILEIVIKLLNKIYQHSGSTGAKTNIESLIEKIWRHYTKGNKYDDCFDSLSLLQEAIYESSFEEFRFKPDYILFRIKNLKLLLLNHQGDTVRSKNLIYDQQQHVKVLSINPENLSLILDFKLIELEYFVNSLNFDEAVLKANDYLVLIDHYQDVWSLFNEDSDVQNSFHCASFWIKSQMAALRIFSLAQSTKPLSGDIDSKFEYLFTFELDHFNRSRLKNYYLLYLLKSNQVDKALKTMQVDNKTIQETNGFDLFWVLNVINTSIVSGCIVNASINDALQLRLEDPRLLLKAHPNDIVWREAALYYWLLGDKSKSLKFIKRAQHLFNLKESPISDLLQDINKVYEAIFKDRVSEVYKDFNLESFGLKDIKCPKKIILLLKNISPY